MHSLLAATTALTFFASTTALAQPTPSVPPGAIAPDNGPALPPLVAAPGGVPRAFPSARLLQARPVSSFFSIPYEVQQGPYTFRASQLEMVVAGSPEAVPLAREAIAKFDQGKAFLISGTVVSFAGIGTAVASIATLNSGNGDTTASIVLLSTTLGLLVVALGLDIVGINVANDGIQKWFEAVNAYNRQLMDGQLQTIPSG